jgi:hypothetical protein
MSYITPAKKFERSMTVIGFSVERGKLIEKQGKYSFEK